MREPARVLGSIVGAAAFVLWRAIRWLGTALVVALLFLVLGRRAIAYGAARETLRRLHR